MSEVTESLEVIAEQVLTEQRSGRILESEFVEEFAEKLMEAHRLVDEALLWLDAEDGCTVAGERFGNLASSAILGFVEVESSFYGFDEGTEE
jgi:hypothetical protein